MKQFWKEIKEWIVSAVVAFFMSTDTGKEYFQVYLCHVDQIKKNQKKTDELRGRINMFHQDLNRSLVSQKKRLEKIERLYNMAVDLENPEYSRTGSWAVIVLDGKPEYMRFIRLPKRDLQEIARFLRQFDVGHEPPTLDAPHGLPKDFFFHNLGRNPDGSR